LGGIYIFSPITVAKKPIFSFFFLFSFLANFGGEIFFWKSKKKKGGNILAKNWLGDFLGKKNIFPFPKKKWAFSRGGKKGFFFQRTSLFKFLWVFFFLFFKGGFTRKKFFFGPKPPRISVWFAKKPQKKKLGGKKVFLLFFPNFYFFFPFFFFFFSQRAIFLKSWKRFLFCFFTQKKKNPLFFLKKPQNGGGAPPGGSPFFPMVFLIFLGAFFSL